MTPLGKIILAQAAELGRNRPPGTPAKDLTLAEMSALTGGQLTKAAINAWITGAINKPTDRNLNLLANALADGNYPKLVLLADMRAAVGLPREITGRSVNVADLSDDDVEVLQAVADRLRSKGREAVENVRSSTDRATKLPAAASDAELDDASL